MTSPLVLFVLQGSPASLGLAAGSAHPLTGGTAQAYFLFGALPPLTFEDLDRAGEMLKTLPREMTSGCQMARVRLEEVGTLVAS